MKLVDKKTGAIVDVPDDKAQAAYMSGQYGVPKGAPVPVKVAGLPAGIVDPADAAKALEMGAHVATEQQYRQAQQQARYGGAGGAVEAAAAGVARGVAGSFGVPLDAAAVSFEESRGGVARHEVDPYAGERDVSRADAMRERLVGLQEQNPIASTLGEMGGMAGAAALGGGAMGAVGHAAEATVGRGLAGSAARVAAEGGFFGGLSAVNESVLGDTPVTAAKVMAGVGHGALIGGTLGGGLHLGAEAVAGVRDRVGRWVGSLRPGDIEAVAEKHFGYAPKGLGEKVQQTYARVSSLASGADEATISRFTALSPEGAEARRIGVYDAPKIQEEAERAVRKHVDDLMNAGDLVSAEARGELKADYVRRAVKSGNEGEVLSYARQRLDALEEGIARQLEQEMAPSMMKSAKTVQKLIARAREAIEARERTGFAPFIEAEAGLEGGFATKKPFSVGKPALDFVPHPNASKAETTIMVNARALDSAWAKDGSFYIGKGEEGIAGRRRDFEKFLEKGEMIQAPRVSVGKDGRAVFTDGRHRFSSLRDKGVDRVAITIEKADLKNLPKEWEVGKLSKTRAREIDFAGSADDVTVAKDPIGFTERTRAAADNADVFIALDNLKRGVQRLTSTGYKSLRLIADPVDQLNAKRTVSWLDGAAQDIRAGLEDEAIWGKAAADQRGINAAWTKQIDASNRFHRSLTTDVGRDPNNPYLQIRGADPAKVSGYVKNLTNPHNDLTHKAVREYVESTRELSESISKSYDLPPEKVAEVSRVKDAASSFERTIGEAESSLVTANQYRQLLEGAESGTVASALGTAGAIVGGLPGGVLGTLAGVAINAARHPGKVVAQMAALERIASQIDHDIGTGVRSFLSGGKAKVLPPASVDILAGKGGERVSFETKVKEIHRLANNPEELVSNVREFTSQFEATAPNLATALTVAAIAGVKYLSATAPPGFTPRPEALEWGIDEPPLYTDAEMREWARRAAVVNDPRVALQSMKRNMLTPEEVHALKHVHAPIYQQLRLEFQKQRIEKPGRLDFGRSLQIELMFDVPLNRTLERDFMRTVQQSFAVPERKIPPKRIDIGSKLSSSARTPAQELGGGYQ